MQHRRIGDVQALVRQQLEGAIRERSSRLPGFHDLPRDERRRIVGRWARLPARQLALLDDRAVIARRNGHVKADAATFAGVEIATYFRINSRDCLVPMADASRDTARLASRGARISRRGDGFFAGHDPESGLAWARARIPPSSLARSGRPGQAVAEALLAQLDSMTAEDDLVVVPPRDHRLEIVIARAVESLGQAVGCRGVPRIQTGDSGEREGGPTYMPRARLSHRGWLDLDLQVQWNADRDEREPHKIEARVGRALVGARLGKDVGQAAASAGLAVALAWLIERDFEDDHPYPGSSGRPARAPDES